MDVQVVRLAPIRVVMLRHRGPYEGLSGVFDELWAWTGAQGVPAGRLIGMYWDNPDEVEASQLRSAACVEVPATFTLGDPGGLRLEVGEIAGGEYATARYVGPYEEMEPVWSRLIAHVEGTLGRRISENPAFEVYVNDPSDTPSHQLITQLYLPVS